MFYRYNHRRFAEWYQAANTLYKQDFNEQRGKQNVYKPLALERDTHNCYLLFIDEEVGLCGSAVFVPLSLPLCIGKAKTLIKPGSWILKDAHFFIEGQNPVHEDHYSFSKVIERFHLGLFEALWALSLESNNKEALVFDPWAEDEENSFHSDLEFFGGFRFSKKLIEEDEEDCMALGILILDAPTCNSYLTKKKAHEKIFGVIPSLSFSQESKEHLGCYQVERSYL